MMSSFGTGLEVIPYKARLSSSYAAGEITSAEYNAALHVAEMEDSVKRSFYKTTWAIVEAGDTVLMPWKSLGEIVEIEIYGRAAGQGLAGKPLVMVDFTFCGDHYSFSFASDETVYVQSRF